MINPLVIKLGGVLLDSEEALERLFTALVTYREKHERPLVIMHGGGCLVDDLMKKLALPVVKKNGLRVTPADQIDIITGALAGTANKTLLAGRLNMTLMRLAYAWVMVIPCRSPRWMRHLVMWAKPKLAHRL